MTRVLALRAEQPPDDAAVVLRAGVMDPANILRTAERTFAIYGVCGVSVEGVIDGTVLEACKGSARIAAYRQIRLSTFGRLRAVGLAVLATFDRPHFTVVLADLTEVTIARLGRCFDDPIPNPGRPASG